MNGNYILVERELADWSTPDAPPEPKRATGQKLEAEPQKMN